MEATTQDGQRITSAPVHLLKVRLCEIMLRGLMENAEREAEAAKAKE